MSPCTIQRHPALDAGLSGDWNILIWIPGLVRDDEVVIFHLNAHFFMLPRTIQRRPVQFNVTPNNSTSPRTIQRHPAQFHVTPHLMRGPVVIGIF